MRDEWTAIIIGWRRRHAFVEEVWLFGSQAWGRARTDSDIDISLRMKEYGGALGLFVAKADDWQRDAGLHGRRAKTNR